MLSRLRCAFTLIELMVVIGIVAVLLGFLLPALSAARHGAQLVKCSSNLRQITQALINYSSEWKGAFPPNSIEIHQYWCSGWTLGRYLKTNIAPEGIISGGVL